MGQIQAIGNVPAVFNLMESLSVQFNGISQYQARRREVQFAHACGRSGVADPTNPVLLLFEKMKKQWKDGDSFA